LIVLNALINVELLGISLNLNNIKMTRWVLLQENRSPLSFKDKQSHSKREDFLSYHLKQNYSEPEPCLWNPIPVRSYMMPYNKKHVHMDNYLAKKTQKSSMMFPKTLLKMMMMTTTMMLMNRHRFVELLENWNVLFCHYRDVWSQI